MAKEYPKLNGPARPYSLAFTVRRRDSGYLYFPDLLDYILAAPPDCKLARIEVEDDHCEKYPRPIARRSHRSVQLQVYINDNETVEQVFTGLRALFDKTDWRID